MITEIVNKIESNRTIRNSIINKTIGDALFENFVTKRREVEITANVDGSVEYCFFIENNDQKVGEINFYVSADDIEEVLFYMQIRQGEWAIAKTMATTKNVNMSS